MIGRSSTGTPSEGCGLSNDFNYIIKLLCSVMEKLVKTMISRRGNTGGGLMNLSRRLFSEQ